MAYKLITNEKMNQEFVGHAEMCTYTFSLGPEQLPGTRWSAQQIIDHHIDALAEENSKLLELRVWEDTEPTWQTNYYVEVVATASPLWWNIIIGGVLLLLIGLAIYFTVKKVDDITRYVGEKAPGALPIMYIAGAGIAALILILMLKRR